ncbi:MAG: hypothetical protein MRY83_22920 [Flavobacteriales bacterium]|nr:hypothetical protein [Flavobacteriales bacterium]
MLRNNLILLLIILSFSCEKDGEVSVRNTQTLDEYITALEKPSGYREVISCAAHASNFDGINVFYLPKAGSHSYKLFTTNTEGFEYRYSEFFEAAAQLDDIFNGAMQKFRLLDKTVKQCVVTYIKNDTVFISDPIVIKPDAEGVPSNLLQIDLEDSLNPNFSWKNDTLRDNLIYFQIVSDQNDNILSGTYTYDKWFQYLDRNNVVLDTKPDFVPLKTSEPYKITIMAVNDYNWVNWIVEDQFSF